jgi:hypothetical protein
MSEFGKTKRRFRAAGVIAAALVVLFASVWASGALSDFITIHLSGTIAQGNIVNAASGSVADIQTAVNSVASTGGRVYVPAGTFDWTPSSTVTIPSGVSIVGAGKGVTILRLVGSASASKYNTMFDVYNSNGRPLRISGISFIDLTNAGNTGIMLDSVKDFRVDNCYFETLGSCGVATYNSESIAMSCGVVDHCDFVNIWKAGTENAGTGFGYGVGVEMTYDRTDQTTFWDNNINNLLGQYKPGVVYIEDCTFTGCRHSICAYATGSYVARYNTFDTIRTFEYNSGHCDVHGRYPDGVFGGRFAEVYGNTFTMGTQNDGHDLACRWRGGGGVIWNNTFNGFNTGYGTIELTYDDGINEKCRVKDLWIWGNDYDSSTQPYIEDYNSQAVLGVDYFLTAKPNYTPYPYPHPLTQAQFP